MVAAVIQGIDTVYNGIRFRSRAEARWACFFDSVGWRWRYEPLDLEGYIPDFVVAFAKPTIIEIKGGALTVGELEDHKAKLEMTSWTGETILLGAQPLWRDFDELNPRIGLMAERDEAGGWLWDACLVHRCMICDRISVHAESGHWRCRLAGCYDGNRYIGGARSDELDALWANACNVTRWMP